jgi:hypothetical protein
MTRNIEQIEAQFIKQTARYVKDVQNDNRNAESNIYTQPFNLGWVSLCLDYVSESIINGNDNLEVMNQAIDFINSNQYGIN